MDEDYGKAVVFYGQGIDAEIDGIVGYRFENFSVVGALDVDRDVGILLFEIRKDFRKNVQAGAFIGAHGDGAAGDVLHFGERSEHGLAGVEGFLGVFLEGLAGRGERDFAAGAVEELGAHFVLDGANLGGDGGLGAETLLRCPGERGVAGYFEEGLELVEVHGAVASGQWPVTTLAQYEYDAAFAFVGLAKRIVAGQAGGLGQTSCPVRQRPTSPRNNFESL